MSNLKHAVNKSTEPKIHNVANAHTATKVTLPKITVTKNAIATHGNGNRNATTGGTTAAVAAAVAAAAAVPVPSTSPVKKKSLSSMSDEEIIQENLNEILDKKSREERKANGRLVAVIVAALVIFLAVYHTWIHSPAALAGVFVPAVIMLSYGAWVVVLAKRDKHRRELFERHIEEVAQKNKAQLEEKARQKHAAAANKYDKASLASTSSGHTTLHYENELDANQAIIHSSNGDHRKKQRRNNHRNGDSNQTDQGVVTVHRSAIGRRPSIREKLFGQTMTHIKLLDVPAPSASNNVDLEKSEPESSLAQKRKRLQRLDTLAMPHVVRMSSVP